MPPLSPAMQAIRDRIARGEMKIEQGPVHIGGERVNIGRTEYTMQQHRHEEHHFGMPGPMAKRKKKR